MCALSLLQMVIVAMHVSLVLENVIIRIEIIVFETNVSDKSFIEEQRFEAMHEAMASKRSSIKLLSLTSVSKSISKSLLIKKLLFSEIL